MDQPNPPLPPPPGPPPAPPARWVQVPKPRRPLSFWIAIVLAIVTLLAVGGPFLFLLLYGLLYEVSS